MFFAALLFIFIFSTTCFFVQDKIEQALKKEAEEKKRKSKEITDKQYKEWLQNKYNKQKEPLGKTSLWEPIEEYSSLNETPQNILPSVECSEISGILKKRKIKYLVHFTKIKNIPNILKYGLLPVQHLDAYNIKSDRNDLKRWDGKLNCISLSVEFPNNKYFYAIRNKTNDKFCVIQLNAYKLLSSIAKKYYLPTNAANKKFKGLIEKYSTPEDFDNMFQNADSCYPEDVQAEILYSGKIPLEFIEEIIFEKTEDVPYAILGGVRYSVNKSFFYPRKDRR